MLAALAEPPFLSRGDFFIAEGIRDLVAGEKTAPVDPWAEVGRNRHVRRCRYNPVRERATLLRIGFQNFPERRLCRNLFVFEENRTRRFDSLVGKASFASLKKGRCLDRVREVLLRDGEACRRLPFLAARYAHGRLKLIHLGLCHEARMIVLVSSQRRPPPLNRVGNENHGPVVINGREGVVERLDAMPSEIRHKITKFAVGTAIKNGAHWPLVPDLVHQPLAPCSATLKRKRRVKRIGATVDPSAKRVASGLREGSLLHRTVLDPHNLPAEGMKSRFDAIIETLADDTVEALAIIVDNPPRVAKPVLPALLQALVDVALVKFGIADKRDHSPLPAVGGQPPGADIILDERGKGRHRHAKTNRTS